MKNKLAVSAVKPQAASNVIGRCKWLDMYKSSAENMTIYHDSEWGEPVKNDDDKLFELLSLEGAQAGLSWQTILNKREGYRKAFYNFNIEKVAKIQSSEVEKLVQNPDIVRHRGKIEGVIKNAKLILQLKQETKQSFSDYVWGFKPKVRVPNPENLPSKEAEEMAKDLKKRGFTFCGPTILYAFMQAVGIVNDHDANCFKHVKYTTTTKEPKQQEQTPAARKKMKTI